jgi:hypothetical protein
MEHLHTVQTDNVDLAKGGVKFDTGKARISAVGSAFIAGLMDLLRAGLRIDLLPFSLVRAATDILTIGAKKYEERNWEKGMAWSRPFNACIRHLFAWWFLRENLDPETGKSHLHHAVTNIAFLIEYETTRPEFDDRPIDQTQPPYQPTSKLEDELVALLQPFAGERGETEGAVDVLKRIIDERRELESKLVSSEIEFNDMRDSLEADLEIRV